MGDRFTMENLNDYPADGTVFIKEGKNDFDNYVKVLPARYENSKRAFSVNRFKFAMYQSHTPKSIGEAPAIFFRYEISPINVFYRTKSKSFYHFAV